MRTAAWMTAPQIALRACSKEAVGGRSIYRILVKGEFNAINIYFTKGFLLVRWSYCHHEGI